MTDTPRTPRATGRQFAWPAALVAAVLTLGGCAGGAQLGEVGGTVTVDGQTPAEGSSITFIPTDGKSAGGGGSIEGGKYATKVPVGNYKVEIRVPKPSKPVKGAPVEGPGPGGPADIEESLPAKYNDQTELTFEVKSGKNEKNWELTK